MERRTFLRNTTIAAATLGLSLESLASISTPPKNKLPKWKGFNLLDFFSPNPSNARKQTSEDELRWMRDWGFDFVRIPIAYPSYLNIDRTKNITPEDILQGLVARGVVVIDDKGRVTYPEAAPAQPTAAAVPELNGTLLG